MERTSVVNRLFLGGTRGVGGTVYGTVLALAALAAGAAEHRSAADLVTLVATTALVIWIAHVYSHALGESIERGHRLDRAELSSLARRELPILLAAAGPTAALLLGAFGLVGESFAIWLAFGVGILALAAYGLRYARLERLSTLEAAAVVAANVALGGLVVLLKVVVNH